LPLKYSGLYVQIPICENRLSQIRNIAPEKIIAGMKYFNFGKIRTLFRDPKRSGINATASIRISVTKFLKSIGKKFVKVTDSKKERKCNA
jgi:hypothetical protein